jgi:hypothetical protein
LNVRARLSIALIVVAFGVGGVIAFGVGSDKPSSASVAPTASAPRGAASLDAVATPAELRLWNDRGCITCHGWNARGTPMGPDLAKVVPLYRAKHGSDEAAHREIVAYLIDPQGSPKLRDDGVQYVNPMPPIERMFGGRREDAEALAGMLLRFAK